MTLSILVTGGTGFLGQYIVDAIIEQHPEWSITVFDLNLPKSPKPSVTYETGDVTIPSHANIVISKAKPKVIIHTAGIVPDLANRFSRTLESRVLSINVDGTRNVLEAAKQHSVSALVWTGSYTSIIDDLSRPYRNISEAYPVPSSSLIYGESKALAERLVLNANSPTLATSALRPSAIFGPSDYQLVPSIHACIAKGETPWIIGPGTNLWDVTYVVNVADAHILAAENLLSSKPEDRTAAGEAIFISNEQPIAFRDFCLAIWAEFGHYPPFEIHVPEQVAAFTGYVAEWSTWLTGSTATLSRGSVRDACAVRYVDGAKARRVLGYSPRVALEEGLKLACEVCSHSLSRDT